MLPTGVTVRLPPRTRARHPTAGVRRAIVRGLEAHTGARLPDVDITSRVSADKSVVWYNACAVSDAGVYCRGHGAADPKDPHNVFWSDNPECTSRGPHMIEMGMAEGEEQFNGNCRHCGAHVVGSQGPDLDYVPGVEILEPLPDHPMVEAYKAGL
jgi:hypothetical protein